MIDFAINDIGDLSVEDQNEYNRFKVNFSSSEDYPKLKINFDAKTPIIEHKSALKIDFITGERFERSKKKRIKTVRNTAERGQSIAIRLKTELGELQDFFSDFGSELNRIRHTDIKLTESKKNLITDYVKQAISDIFATTEVNVNVERVDSNSGNFKLETLKITISTNDGEIIYTYNI